MDFGAEAINRGFDGAVENLDERYEERGLYENELLKGGYRKPKRERNEHRAKENLFAEGRFFSPGGGKALHRVARGVEEASQALFAFELGGVGGYFHGAQRLGSAAVV